jgi:hypothetical protein
VGCGDKMKNIYCAVVAGVRAADLMDILCNYIRMLYI